MKKRSKKKKVGLPPGSMVYTGKERKESVRMTLLDYDLDRFKEKKVSDLRECVPFKESPTVTWLNIDGVHDMELLGEVGELFGIHPLVMEDIVNVEQRPKVEFFSDHIFIVMKMLMGGSGGGEMEQEQVSMVLGKDFVISFQERKGDVFDHVRDRIRGKKGRIRGAGADYLTYALMDALVDRYFILMEEISDSMEHLEEEVLKDPDQEILKIIYDKKRKLIGLKRVIWPLREVVNSLTRDDNPLIDQRTIVYLRDVYDHTVRIIETLEGMKDNANGLTELYMTSVSNRMNEVMKVLTIIATIFIPLTFIAGIYGMNFDPGASPFNMPELNWYWGYPAVLALMGGVTIGMIIYFRKKKWL
ncbi:MAG: magnesium/cobalt transporter CorA [Thermoplasmatota archaeon]